MAETSKIEWTDATWNPIVGCSIVSPACTNCYAMAMAAQLERMSPGSHYAGTTEIVNSKPVWTGVLRQAPESVLLKPLRWKKPRRIFVNSMSDLFHESVPDEWIDHVFAVMALAHWHTLQSLTKRTARMRAYMSDPRTPHRIARVIVDMWIAKQVTPDDNWPVESIGDIDMPDDIKLREWPLPNVWLGVTVEDQPRADERRDHLRELAKHGWMTFVSYEPALDPVDWSLWYFVRQIICGGESGPRARPMHPDWARATHDFCAVHDIAFFFKQWGEWGPTSSVDVYCHGPNRNERLYPNSDGVAMLADGRVCMRDFSVAEHKRRIRTGIACDTRAIEVDKTAIAEFTGQIRLEGRALDNPLGFQWMYRVGKRRAGRLLDGCEHNAFPETRP
ncbi:MULTISPECIES: phage Gp37/Gp68 family protein [Methylosinus]|uniref:Phage Gp37/Gp68 family protein n=1 Tax=Methylosinus trichosporium (strain ATCC 35070 / NCIMB 11131 / UNIQEM 75 / OB3b) TaxID=595536 RepID=A0A2D2CYI0_METT3|nr:MULTISPECIES: phage Gp37/Gp68 family protein [Methylosinus]ATQ67787.1 phage Gp37/Gp68 family protein [Methylosinus trichosporium OB3b]OBS51808.1 hypothetical protein A8B73_14205 [Methylosinus sp. 3S-1]